ncbi:MAG: ABC transporter ATP-binding protein/permease, partial [Proteobacteria bacterium]|nr:ABC transporter ATP-binding protein/permease [Pseudomonadota bacterium]
IYKGQSVGIIGVSGAGKSTLMDLIIGLLPPTSGTLLLDGRELDEPSRTAWMRHVGYVSQQPYVLDATLAQNIAFGIPEDDIDPVRLRECCELSAVNEFLEVLAEGLETWLGENGSRLSGGQQQRVCIARALYPNPDLLIFDEATSSLDNKNEAFIRETIQGLKGKQTMIIVAHRLSTVELCDTVIWLENGKLHQIGAPSKIIPNYLKSQLHITKQIR